MNCSSSEVNLADGNALLNILQHKLGFVSQIKAELLMDQWPNLGAGEPGARGKTKCHSFEFNEEGPESKCLIRL